MIIKTILFIARLLVGGLFVFSGLIKVNDPVGTSIKMQEYFDVFSTDISPIFEPLKAIALPIAVILVILEVALGIMVLVGWKVRTGIYLLLLMILFFTFLTFYSAYYNKVTDCGCFGDAIKLTPWESFYKDIVLLVLIVFMVVFRKQLPEGKTAIGKWLTVGSFVLSLVLAVYAIRNLPFIDFRAFKEGVNIPRAMEPSANLEYSYLMRKDGKTVEFDQYPSDESYEFVEMNLKNPEALPKISDFAIWNDNGDHTQQMLSGKKLLIFSHSIQKMDLSLEQMEKISGLINAFQGSDVQVALVAASSEAEMEQFLKDNGIQIGYYMADATVVKTIVRSNPGLVFLEEGTVLGKFHFRNTPDPETAQSLFGQ
ncbi:BT_3928 family protein [Cyclobacterium plantarum]|uniref:DoxX family protein n=1 Tax=Cyclobacterium plantarum TaxID=2716263 RepID=A0ABX0H6Y7_9BACT|nr:BT_3928 family protein [Cyclobacterium plantarum]NHE57645.1 DoxX family protein [Cyclobacterium plantarum]